MMLLARQWLDRAQGEDVVQEVFIRLMHQSEPPRNVKAWLFVATRNASISEGKSQSRRRGREMRLAQQRGEWFEERADDLIDAAAAQDALARLPEDQREIIVLRLWAQMTFEEIRDITGLPLSTLFSRYKSGLSRLKQMMENACQTKKTL